VRRREGTAAAGTAAAGTAAGTGGGEMTAERGKESEKLASVMVLSMKRTGRKPKPRNSRKSQSLLKRYAIITSLVGVEEASSAQGSTWGRWSSATSVKNGGQRERAKRSEAQSGHGRGTKGRVASEIICIRRSR
jgi:hypothetical protein